MTGFSGMASGATHTNRPTPWMCAVFSGRRKGGLSLRAIPESAVKNLVASEWRCAMLVHSGQHHGQTIGGVGEKRAEGKRKPPSLGTFSSPLSCDCSVFLVQNAMTEQTRSSVRGLRDFREGAFFGAFLKCKFSSLFFGQRIPAKNRLKLPRNRQNRLRLAKIG